MGDETAARNVYAPVLRQAPIFRALGDTEVEAVLDQCVKRDYTAETVVLQEGENGNSLLIIVEGEVEYMKGKKVIGKDGVGAFFGEIAMLSRLPTKRQATVRAKTDCVLLEFYRPEFQNLLRKYPEVGVTIIDTLVDRIRASAPIAAHKSKVVLTLAAMLLPMIAKLLTKHFVPPDMANETAQWVVDQMEVYLLPLLATVGLAARAREVKAIKTALTGS